MSELSESVATHSIVQPVQLEDATVVIIGEHHSSDDSAALVTRVLDELSPEAVCIEACPSRWRLLDGHAPSKGGKAARMHAEECGIPLYLIDEEQEMVANALIENELTNGDQPTPPEPDGNGDIDAAALNEYRDIVRRQEPERYRVVWEQRETRMRQRVRTIAEDHSLVACVVGASHVAGLKDDLRTAKPVSVEDGRVVLFD